MAQIPLAYLLRNIENAHEALLEGPSSYCNLHSSKRSTGIRLLEKPVLEGWAVRRNKAAKERRSSRIMRGSHPDSVTEKLRKGHSRMMALQAKRLFVFRFPTETLVSAMALQCEIRPITQRKEQARLPFDIGLTRDQAIGLEISGTRFRLDATSRSQFQCRRALQASSCFQIVPASDFFKSSDPRCRRIATRQVQIEESASRARDGVTLAEENSIFSSSVPASRDAIWSRQGIQWKISFVILNVSRT